MILIVFYIPFILLFAIIAFILINSYNKALMHLKYIMGTLVDFSKVIKYYNGSFYVNNKKCSTFKQLALQLQQTIGSIKEDDITITNVNDIS